MIYLVRHGKTLWNLEGRKQGRLDSPLIDCGLAQAEVIGLQLRRSLRKDKPFRVVSSPLGRAMATALIIVRQLGLSQEDITTEPLLVEYNMGSWQGLTNRQIDERYPGTRKRRDANKWEYVISGGESYARVYERARVWLSTVSEDKVVIAVTHEMISRTIQGVYGRLDSGRILTLSHPHNVIYRLQQREVRKIICEDMCAKRP